MLSDRDRSGEQLLGRLNAVKRLERVDVSGHPPARLPRAIARAVLDRHVAGTRSIVVLNRVDLAQGVLRALRQELKGSGPDIVLVHSRFRPPERAARMAEALAVVADGPGRIVVSTQVIEAGVDTSAALLATETAPFSSLVQRWGRCNRAGELAEGVALWLDRGELDPRSAAPYEAPDLGSSRAALLSLVGTSVSPAMLAGISVSESRRQSAVLRRRDLVDLFDTSPDVSGMDVDVSRFIRDEDERTVSVFFRDLEPREPDRDPKGQAYAQRDELVEVPIAAVASLSRVAWVFDHVDDVWRSAGPADRHPGATLMLRASDGGYDEHLGWTGARSDRPAPISAPSGGAPEAIGDERQSFTREWRTLAEHLADAEAEAVELLSTLGSLDLPDDADEALCGAAALHDIGKAHPAFQAMLLSRLDENERAQRADTVWAKSGLEGGRHVRRHFRHELASALALLSADVALDAVGCPSELAVYLIASHHGRVRMSIRPAPDERPPPDRPDARRFALGVAEGDELPAVSTPWGVLPPTRLGLESMELGGGGRSWSELACELRDRSDLGPFRLAYLEALLRIVDWRASG